MLRSPLAAQHGEAVSVFPSAVGRTALDVEAFTAKSELFKVPQSVVIAVSVAAEDLEKGEEDVDEVEVQAKRTENAQVVAKYLSRQYLQFLRVEGGETRKNDDRDTRQSKGEGAAMQKHVDDARDDQSDDHHYREAADTGQVSLGCETVQRHHPKDKGSRQEGSGDRSAGVNREDPGKRDPVQRRIEEECAHRRRVGHLLDVPADEPYDSQLSKDH